MKAHQIDRVALIPTLVDPFSIGTVAEKLNGVMRSCLSGGWRGAGMLMYKTTVTGSGKFSILGKMYRIYEKVENETCARVMKEHPDKFLGWIFVNPGIGISAGEVNKWARMPGWIGVKSHPFWHRYPVKMLDDVAAICAERGMPLLIHLGAGEYGDFKFLPDRHPKLKLIYAHAGIPFFRELWDYIKGKANLYVDISSPYLDEKLRLEVIKHLGAEKCIYGSDGPYGCPNPADGMYDHGSILGEIQKAKIPDSDKELILGVNFRNIVGRNL
jgi:predicted TIM-barrel fold metal-dependent hydrolase